MVNGTNSYTDTIHILYSNNHNKGQTTIPANPAGLAALPGVIRRSSMASIYAISSIISGSRCARNQFRAVPATGISELTWRPVERVWIEQRIVHALPV